MSIECRRTGFAQTRYVQRDDGLTRQDAKDECDINVIVRNYDRHGFITHVQRAEAHFGVHTGMDFREAMEAIAEAEDAFAALPATLRRRFNNDPAELLEFVADDGNRAEAQELGLLERTVTVAPDITHDEGHAPLGPDPAGASGPSVKKKAPAKAAEPSPSPSDSSSSADSST